MARAKKRADGRYGKKVTIGTNQYKYVCAKSQKELDEKVLQLKLKVGKGLDLSADRDTFEEWGKLWLTQKKSTVCVKTYQTLEARYKRFERLYKIPISKIRLNDFQSIFYELSCGENALSKKTLTGLKQDASQIMELAIANRVIDYNCAKAIMIPNTAKPAEHRRALTKEEQRWIRETPHRAQTAAMIMLYAGLRRGDLLALTWSDIDLERKTISINKAVEFVSGRPSVKNCGKTEAALRTVYIPSLLVDYLGIVDKTTLLVCPSARGSLMSDTAWKRMWESYLTELNFRHGDFRNFVDLKVISKFQPGGLPKVIPNITAHWLRHTFITNMYFAGIDLLTAKEQAGHSDIRTTAEIYTHLDADFKERKMQDLDEYLKKQMASSS